MVQFMRLSPRAGSGRFHHVALEKKQRRFPRIHLQPFTVLKVLAVALLCSGAVLAQQDPNSQGQASAGAGGGIFGHDFVNFFLFGNGVYDSRVPTISATDTTVYGSGLGWEAGGGVTASHEFKGGSLYLNYKGDYRDYKSLSYSGGTDQSLYFTVKKQLNRRWSVSSSVQGGILVYGGGFYSALPSAASSVLANPFSVQTRFASTEVSVTYRQTRRLSYVFSGSLFLNDYNYKGTVSSRGVTGTGSVLYSLTSQTTFGGTYSHSYYSYSGGTGTTNIDGGSLTFSHKFPMHWQLDLSARRKPDKYFWRS